MDIIYKVLVTILSTIVLLAGGYAITMNISNDIAVNNYFETVTQTIIESDYNQTVIDQCIDDAASNGYELTVEVYGADTFGVKKYADIKITYVSEIKLFGISSTKVKQKVI